MHRFWQCEGCSSRFFQSNSIAQGNAAVGGEVNWSVSVTGVGNGTCSYALPAGYSSLGLTNSSGGIPGYSLSGDVASWECNFSSSNFSLHYTTAAPNASEGGWAQDASKTSSLSVQYAKKTVSITNPSGADYANVSWSTGCLSGFACDSAGSSLSSLQSGGTISVTINASGDALLENWESDFSQDSSRTTRGGGVAYVKRGLNVSSTTTLGFTQVNTSWSAKPSWNCSAPDSVNVPAAGYSNGSFVECSKNNAVTKNEAGWVLDAGYDNTLESQRFFNALDGSNSEDVAFSSVYAAAEAQSPEGNLSQKNEELAFNDIAAAAGAGWGRNATSASNWINKTIELTQNGTWTWYTLRAENATNFSMANVRGWINLDDSFVKLYPQAYVNSSAGQANITPSSTCPNWQSFSMEENGTNYTWKSCSKDSNGNGLVDRFEFIVPHFSSVIVVAGGRGLKVNGENCSQSSECSSTYCAAGTCAQQQGNGGSGDTGGNGGGGWGGGGGGTAVPEPSPSPGAGNEPQGVDEGSHLNATDRNEGNAGIDIRVPGDGVEEGYHSITVLENGAPASGKVRITSPDGSVYVRELGPDGTLTFFFDKDGDWRIEFNNAAKKLRVTRSALPSPSVIALSAAPGGMTGMFVKGVSVPAIAAALVMLVALCVAAHLRQTRVKVAKKFEKGLVEIRVTNRKKDLEDATLIDIAPRGSVASGFSEDPLQRETIFGTALKWHRKKLKKGEAWSVKYGLDVREPRAKKLRQAELKAKDASGNEVVASSGEIELQ
jgi:hypothetical protein